MGISIGLIGTGQFSHSFIPLWQRHPDVDDVRITEVLPERMAETKQRHDIETAYESEDELPASDVDAAAAGTARGAPGADAARGASTSAPPGTRGTASGLPTSTRLPCSPSAGRTASTSCGRYGPVSTCTRP